MTCLMAFTHSCTGGHKGDHVLMLGLRMSRMYATAVGAKTAKVLIPVSSDTKETKEDEYSECPRNSMGT
jgi:hypothetical protein